MGKPPKYPGWIKPVPPAPPVPTTADTVAGLSRDPRLWSFMGLVFAVIGACVLIATIMDTVDFRDGIRVTATCVKAPDGTDGQWVRFEAEGQRIVVKLPAPVKMLDEGDEVAIRYERGNPDHIVVEKDVGAGAIFWGAAFAAFGISWMTAGVVRWVREERGEAGRVRGPYPGGWSPPAG
ncbi:DUF3592 domain-containing protein [Streptomyces smaragdinus]|nr:DUF3592 domain-containing protein [Streptomyces smaragdinus]